LTGTCPRPPAARGEPQAFDPRWCGVRDGLGTICWAWVPHLLATLALLALLAPHAQGWLGARVAGEVVWGAGLAYLIGDAGAVWGLLGVARLPAETGARPLAWAAVLCFLVTMGIHACGVGVVRWVAERAALPLDGAERVVERMQWLLLPLAEALGVALLLAALWRVTRAVGARSPGVAGVLLSVLLGVQVVFALWPHFPGAPRLPRAAPLAARLAGGLLALGVVGDVAASLWMARALSPRGAAAGAIAPRPVAQDHAAWAGPLEGLGLYVAAFRPALALFVFEAGLRAVGPDGVPTALWRWLSLLVPPAGAATAMAMAVGLLRFGRAPAASGGRAGALEAVGLLVGVAAAHLAEGGLLVAERAGVVVPYGTTVLRSLALAEHLLPLFALVALTASLGRVAERLGRQDVAWSAAPAGRLLAASIAAALAADLARFTGAIDRRAAVLLTVSALALGVVAVARHLGVAQRLHAGLREAPRLAATPRAALGRGVAAG
jgi:hypothetical protein